MLIDGTVSQLYLSSSITFSTTLRCLAALVRKLTSESTDCGGTRGDCAGGCAGSFKMVCATDGFARARCRAGCIGASTDVGAGTKSWARAGSLCPHLDTFAKCASAGCGADADISIWDPNETRIVGDMHDAMDYNPFEGMKITGWPTTVLTRGQRVIDEGKLHANPGDGNFIHRSRTDLTGLSGTFLPETDPKTNFGAEIFQ